MTSDVLVIPHFENFETSIEMYSDAVMFNGFLAASIVAQMLDGRLNIARCT